MKTSQSFPTLTRDQVPDEIRGTPPRWWQGQYDAVLAWGPFVVERSSFGDGAPQFGILLRVDDDWLTFDIADRVIVLPISSRWRIDGETLSVRSHRERVTVRPVRQADRAIAYYPPVPANVADFPAFVRQAWDW